MRKEDHLKGMIFDIQRFSVHDGPGIRTLIFLKGCPLSCWWCSNPEGQHGNYSLFYIKNKCISCEDCIETCSNHAHELDPSHRFLRQKCILCFECAKVCPTGALRKIGSMISVDEAISKVYSDQVFYQHSNGGVTLGGGEPTFQTEWSKAFLKKCKKLGIHTAMETCGYTSPVNFRSLVPYLDLILFDLKIISSKKHMEATGKDNQLILSNLSKLLNQEWGPLKVIIRVAVIPEINDSLENFYVIAAFIKENIKNNGVFQRVELLPYHKLGLHKYKCLGKNISEKQNKTFTTARLEELHAVLKSHNIPVRLEKGMI